MTLPLTIAPTSLPQTYLGAPLVVDLDTLVADVAVIGMPYGNAYEPSQISNDQSNAPDVVRSQSRRAHRFDDRYDFDIGGTLFDGRPIKLVDVGNVPFDIHEPQSHFSRAEAAVRKILAAGAMPITLGGDHGVPIAIFRALEQEGPITLIQIDAHIDWREDVNGVRDGLSSPIRRASEMAHIGEIFQIGIRSQGSARAEDVEAALAHGAKIIPAFEVHDEGIDAVLARIPAGGRYYITIDADGLDPTVMPAVRGPAPGGLIFHQVRRLIHGLVNKGRVVGMDIVEITPSIDLHGITSMVANRLIINLIGAAVRANYFNK
ncbi:agmatinase [Boseaceae bacterium BT-24-1]|nr:agmatinase [Boseaceae bacterium BT-24-1]